MLFIRDCRSQGSHLYSSGFYVSVSAIEEKRVTPNHVVGFVSTVGYFLQSVIIGWLSLKMGRKKKKATKPWCWYPLHIQNTALCRFEPDRSCGRPAFQNLDHGYRLWFRKSCFHKILNPSLCIRSFNRQCYLQYILLLHKNVLGMTTANYWRCDWSF